MNRLADVLLLRMLPHRDRRAILLGLAVLLPVLLYVAAVRPYRAALADVRDRIAAERALLEREETLVAHAGTLPPTVAALQERAAGAERRLVSAANVPLAEAEVTGFLEELAQLSRVLLQELRGVESRRGGARSSARASRDQAENVGALRAIRLSVRGESDLEGVLTFLSRLENSPLLLRIAELSIEPQFEGTARTGDRRPSGVVTFALIVEAFAPPDIERAAAEEVSP
jgi:hypothetical protein